MKPIPLRIRRPRPVVVYCALSLATGTYDLVDMLTSLDIWALEYEEVFGLAEGSRDVAIVTACALFTIVLIPLTAIWFFASKIARIFVSVMSVLVLGSTAVLIAIDGFDEAVGEDRVSLLLASLSSVAAILLWRRPANEWFDRKGARDADAFA